MKKMAADWGKDLPAHTKEVIDKLQENNFIVYVVGGAVRDFLLGQKPKDFDLVSNAKPEEIFPLFEKTIAIGAHFGIAMVVINGHTIEIATFRKDKEYKDSRHPEGVEFSDPKEDAKRRDFTINGLFWDPEKNEVIDYVGGIEDIKTHVIRAIGDAELRFEEDALRMLRAVRFLAQLSPKNFTLDIKTLNGIKKQKERLRKISRERITQEMNFLLAAKKPSPGLFAMQESGLLEVILPELDRLPAKTKEKNFLSVDLVETKERLLRWAVLLQNNLSDFDKIMPRFIFSKNEIKKIHSVITLQKTFLDITDADLVTQKKFLSDENFLDALAFFKTTTGIQSIYDFCFENYNTYAKNKTLNPEALLSGEDLKKLGYSPGPEFKKIFAYLKNEQLAEKIHSKDEAIALIKKHFPK